MDHRERAAELFRWVGVPPGRDADGLVAVVADGWLPGRLAEGPTPQDVDRLVLALDDPAPLVRHVAAIALAMQAPERLPESAIRELLGTLASLEYLESPALAEEYLEITATEDDAQDLGQDIAVAFSLLRCGQADFVVWRLLEFWSFDAGFYELAFALLALAFPPSDRELASDALSGVQRRILTALVREEAIWKCCGGFGEALASRGLPRDRRAMSRFLGRRVDP